MPSLAAANFPACSAADEGQRRNAHRIQRRRIDRCDATGSTAYSFSAGGPILEPESGVLVITPICPHVLTNRSIIVAETSVIEIEVSDPDYPVFLTLDGREPLRVEQGSTVVRSKSETNASVGRVSRGFVLQRRPPEIKVEWQQRLSDLL